MRLLMLASVLAAIAPVPTLAQDGPPSAPGPAAAPADPFGGGAVVVDNDALRQVTGQADLAQLVQAQNRSTVSGNSVVGNSQTGTIVFDPTSFQNLNGLSLLSANTGNNVSINSSLNVNIAINQ